MSGPTSECIVVNVFLDWMDTIKPDVLRVGGASAEPESALLPVEALSLLHRAGRAHSLGKRGVPFNIKGDIRYSMQYIYAIYMQHAICFWSRFVL
jgi:hypothetical protein